MAGEGMWMQVAGGPQLSSQAVNAHLQFVSLLVSPLPKKGQIQLVAGGSLCHRWQWGKGGQGRQDYKGAVL